MNLTKFPRRRYTAGATPIEKLERLSAILGGPDIYIKRDDLLGLAGGGNKTRKLEFLMGGALRDGADTVITCGAVQSNHCRLSLAAAAKEGLKCRLVLEQRVPGSYDRGAGGNNFLYNLLDAEAVRVVDAGSDMMGEMMKLAEELRAQGRRPAIFPGGGSNEIGALGYVSCAKEIMWQAHEQGLDFDYIVCTSGSAGTQAGLVTGLIGGNAGIPVVGIAISRKKEAQRQRVYGLCEKTADLLKLGNRPGLDDIIVFDDYIGEGYSLPTKGMVATVRLLARTEAVLLDPVYTGKAMDGLIDLVGKGYFKGAKNILFLHTGGSPALYVYMKDFA